MRAVERTTGLSVHNALDARIDFDKPTNDTSPEAQTGRPRAIRRLKGGAWPARFERFTQCVGTYNPSDWIVFPYAVATRARPGASVAAATGLFVEGLESIDHQCQGACRQELSRRYAQQRAKYAMAL